MKKIILISSIVLALVIGVVIWASLSHGKVARFYCELRGGTIIPHSFGTSCEIKASDAGKECFFNSDCRYDCEYPTPFNILKAGYPNELQNKGGRCADYRGSEGTTCTRDRGQDVKCTTIIS
jgi:hypothetical protein